MEQENPVKETVPAIPLHVTEARPDNESLAIPLMPMLVEELTLPSLGAVMATSGGVWSRFTVTFAVALLPIVSVAVPLMIWFAPSMFTDCDVGQATGGAPPVHTKLTVTGVLFQPAAFDAGDTDATICNGGKF